MLKLTIDGVHIELDKELVKYAERKIGRLERYVPRRARPSAHGEITLKRAPSKDKNKFTCEITLHLPHGILNCQETTQHLYAAIDVASVKMQHQLAKYKTEYGVQRMHRRLIDRLRSGRAA